MKNNLLRKARKAPTQRRANRNDPRVVDVSLAWIKGEITASQVAMAIEKKAPTGSTYSLLSIGLRLAYQAGKLKIQR